MIRNIFWAAFCLAPCLLFSQIVDSVAIRQVDSLIQVSRALTGKREFDKALEVNAAAEKLALEKLGRESAAYGSCCFNRGRVCKFKGDYPEAEKWYNESKFIREKALGKEHPDYASTLNNLGTLYMATGNYEKAEIMLLETKDIRRKALGTEHPDYAAILSTLGLLYTDMGDYEKAEPLMLESKVIRERNLGKEHPDYAASVGNLAILYIQMGNYEKAEPSMLETIAIREKTLGKEHPEYAKSVNNLAIVYMSMGNYKKAEPLYLEAKTIWGNVLGTAHPDYAKSVNNLANLYMFMGAYEKAEPLFLEAIAIREKTQSKNHPDYADCLHNLANLYYLMGLYEKAELIFLETRDIYAKTLGKEHKTFAANLTNLSSLYVETGAYSKAEPLFTELSWRNQSLLQKAIHHLSERELGSYLNQFSESQDLSLSFVQLSASKKTTAACFDNSLFYKGFLLQTAGQIKRMSLTNPAATENFNLLRSCEERLAAQYAQPISDRDSTVVTTLETEVNGLEKELARTVAGFGQAMRQVKWQEVQAALKPGEVAIEFVSYRFYQKKQTDSTMYAALVLLPAEASAKAGVPGATEPQFIPLFEEKQLTPLLQTNGKPQPIFYNELYATDKKGSQLYDLVWKPIAAALPEGTTAYCSPSGLLHRLNLGGIPTPDGKTLAEKHRLTTLGSTRQLVVPPVLATNQNATAQLYGGIQYDATPAMAANVSTNTDDFASRRGADFAQNDSTLRGETWNYLRWTEVEVSAAAEIMKGKDIAPTLKKGAEATEESFKKIGEGSPSPRVLHVATHGFFFPDPKGEKASDEKTFKVSENPMIRSGLVLAGGNHAWKTGKPLRPDLEDGILTAYEISQMNLSNTELVVLSACETGLGDLVGNEGVYGLQRAFKIAGARYLIMSLWQVPDFQTQVFMTAFYKHWLEEKMAVSEAFRATQSEMKVKYGEAFKWAGFVLVE